MEISKKLSDLRKKRNLKVKEMAELLNIPESTYRGYEYGSKLPADLVPGICKITGVSFEEFYNSNKVFLECKDSSVLSTIKDLEVCLEKLKESVRLAISRP